MYDTPTHQVFGGFQGRRVNALPTSLDIMRVSCSAKMTAACAEHATNAARLPGMPRVNLRHQMEACLDALGMEEDAAMRVAAGMTAEELGEVAAWVLSPLGRSFHGKTVDYTATIVAAAAGRCCRPAPLTREQQGCLLLVEECFLALGDLSSPEAREAAARLYTRAELKWALQYVSRPAYGKFLRLTKQTNDPTETLNSQELKDTMRAALRKSLR